MEDQITALGLAEDDAQTEDLVPRTTRRLFLFGGYGGTPESFGRYDYNDLKVLDLEQLEWSDLETTGDVPEERSGAQLVFVPRVVPPNEPTTAPRLYLSGGWNALGQFNDVRMLDLETLVWTLVESASDEKFGPERWEHSMVAVDCVPHWKVFTFGGKSGDLSLESGLPLGTFNSDLFVLETGSAAPDVWVRPDVTGAVLPPPRADSPIAYDPHTQVLAMFGGWANKWFGDLWLCDVKDVVGPPYSIHDCEPKIGAVTGDTNITLHGMGLAKLSGEASVMVSCPKGSLEVPATVESDHLLTFQTPDYTGFGAAQDVYCRLKIAPKSYTNTSIAIQLFEVTDCAETIAFGPGIINHCAAGDPVSFVIQAKDKNGADRWCGMDEFSVAVAKVVTPEEKKKGITPPPVEVALADSGDGTYLATYTLPEKGNYTVDVVFAGTFAGSAGPIRGSPFAISVLPSFNLAAKDVASAEATLAALEGELEKLRAKHEDLEAQYNEDPKNDKLQSAEITARMAVEKQEEAIALGQQGVADAKEAQKEAVDGVVVNAPDGPLAMGFYKSSTREVKSFSTDSLAQLKEANPSDELDPLVRVKNALSNVQDQTVTRDLCLASNRTALRYLKRTKPKLKDVDRMLKDLETAQGAWNTTKKEVQPTSKRITQSNAKWTDKVEDSIEKYTRLTEDRVFNEMKKRKMWDFETGVEAAATDMGKADYWLRTLGEELEENATLCRLFEFPKLIDKARAMYDDMKSWMVEMRRLWDVAKKAEDFIGNARRILWAEMNVDDLEDGAKRCMKLVKGLSKDVRWSNAFIMLDKECKDFLNTVPLIQNLGNKAMRGRHWKQIMEVTHKNFVPPLDNPEMILQEIIDLHLHEFAGDVDEVCDQSQKEDKMEKQLMDLDDRYKKLNWMKDDYKTDATVPMLKMDGDDFEVLEADQLAVQGMLASRYIAQFQTECDAWRESLNNIAEGFAMFQEIQRTWSYLEPLFIGSAEVRKELPQDAKRFAKVDEVIRDTLRSTFKHTNIKVSCDVPGLLKTLENANEQLNICKKALKDFLESRQRQFPRFFFIAEADLLDILSNGSEPRKILHHTPKVYLCASTFNLAEKDTPEGRPIATQLVAGVGKEVTDLAPPVPLEGKVEQYMEKLIDVIKVTLFEAVKRSIKKYHEMDRVRWLMHRMDGSDEPLLPKRNEKSPPSDPAQVILYTLNMNYAAEVEEAFAALDAGDPNAMAEYNAKQIEQIKALIAMAIKVKNKGDMMRVMVCITMDAHNRDCVKNKLLLFKITDVNNFQWQSQLKHKWRVSPPHASFLDRDTHLRGPAGERAEVAICDAILPYDYEYLGNGFRLVITPLTDRIYVTATQALNLAMGCAPAGPAGTGKTETTKDLSNALAKLVYVLNCSPDMDYKSLGAVWQGVSSSGAWICFDEFNRLVPEVLSVCTVQFKAVCDGIKAGAARVSIEGSEVVLNPTCGAFITMNPGYLGRSELPEGLKALFRPITVMVPDLVLICENFLMAQGFEDAQVLASKFYGLYSLLKDLLSKQMHYDWGLRAVKSVLYVAGGFKRAEPDMNEQALLMRALRDFNVPKIIKEDEVVFFGLLGDLFPGLNPPRSIDEDLERNVERACVEQGLDPDEVFRLKVVQLEELVFIRHCTFMMGPPMCGKSTCWRTLQKAREYEPGQERLTYVHDISAKVMLTRDLYGYTSLATREWQDGVLSKIMRDLGNMDSKPKWIMLDGDLDANWIESMNSVMDDNKILTLPSNERIPLKDNMKMIFEIRNLKYATPATVSRAGILYISADDGTQWRSLIAAWLKTTCKVQLTDQQQAWLKECFDGYCAVTMRELEINYNKLGQVVPREDINMIASLLFMLDSQLTPKNLSSKERVEQIFAFCAVWAFGSGLHVSDDGTDYNKMFSEWWKSNFKAVKFPPRDTVFDYWLNPGEGEEDAAFDQWTKSPYFVTIPYDSHTPSKITPILNPSMKLTHPNSTLASLAHQ